MIISVACITETKWAQDNLSGFNFEISETDCDTFGSSLSVSIFASKVGESSKSLLFKYDPGSYPYPLPKISVSDDQKITVSIPVISSIYEQQHNWRYGSVNYKIGNIKYPVNGISNILRSK
jgi:hypothetical protein